MANERPTAAVMNRIWTELDNMIDRWVSELTPTERDEYNLRMGKSNEFDGEGPLDILADLEERRNAAPQS
jgi:hypothetical protein